MKKSTFVLLLLVVLVSMTACTRVNPGFVGVKVNNTGTQRGVENSPALTGWVWYNPITSDVFEYPTFVQTASWTRTATEGSASNEEVSFNSKEGLPLTADVSLSYQLRADKVPSFYVKFRSDDLNAFTHGYLRTIARDKFNEVAGHYSIEELYGPKKAEFVLEVKEQINNEVKAFGVEIQQFGFIGAPRPPEQFLQAINAKVTATQNAMRAENERRQVEAEAAKQIAAARGQAESQIERARGEAEANRLRQQSITPELLKLRELEIQQIQASRWNGVLPSTIMGGQAVPLIQMK